MTKIKNLKDNSKSTKISSEELAEMKQLSSSYKKIKEAVAEFSMRHYTALRNMEAMEARMSKFNNDITEKYSIKEGSYIDSETGEIK